jgi:transposase
LRYDHNASSRGLGGERRRLWSGWPLHPLRRRRRRCPNAASVGEVDYTGGISKCGDRRVRTLLYEAANVMLTRYKGQLKLKDWAFAIAKRSTMRKARVALARRLAIIMHAMLRDGTAFISA